MANEIQGADIAFYVRDYSASPTGTWKRLVCEDTLVFDLTSDVNTTKTKCGTFKGLLVPDFKVSGTGVANSAPTASEYSHDEMTDDINTIQKKSFRIQDVATLGSVILLSGDGYFSSQQITFNNGEVVKFTYNFEGTGTLENHES